MHESVMPVFAEFGGAVHTAQRLEFGLTLLLAFAVKFDEAVIGKSTIDRLSSKDAEKTLGELWHAVKKSEYLTRAEQKQIRKAIKERNILVHSYLVDKSELLLTPEGRKEMLKDIRRVQNLLRKADDIIESLVDRYLAEHEVDLDEITRQLDTLWIEDGGLQNNAE
ncbi:MAG: DUF86 domain-containing protein [Gammaproteobacteria bacterium]|nr:DUF86 domain-containing protein [Gammaproteobacteria bacterium]NIW57096.1 DUF86 domain-containing protein [Gammaproteobacteria bacterium]